MNSGELDEAYTHLCRTMTDLGSAQAQHFLARFAVLALSRELTVERARRLIDDAASSLRADAAGSLRADAAAVTDR